MVGNSFETVLPGSKPQPLICRTDPAARAWSTAAAAAHGRVLWLRGCGTDGQPGDLAVAVEADDPLGVPRFEVQRNLDQDVVAGPAGERLARSLEPAEQAGHVRPASGQERGVKSRAQVLVKLGDDLLPATLTLPGEDRHRPVRRVRRDILAHQLISSSAHQLISSSVVPRLQVAFML